MNNDRKMQILSLTKQEGEIRLSKLRELFPDVSEMTLRRDLDSLEKDMLVQRTHGGAKLLLNEVQKFQSHNSNGLSANSTELDSLLKKAASFLEEDRSIYLDSGSIMLSFAENMPDIRLYTITNAPDVSLAVMKKTNTEVILLGGSLNKNSISLTGSFALDVIEKLNIDVAFLSASGLSLEAGFTTPYASDCELKKKVIQIAKKVIILIEHTRLNRSLPFTYAALEDVDVIICNNELPQNIFNAAESHGIEIVC